MPSISLELSPSDSDSSLALKILKSIESIFVVRKCPNVIEFSNGVVEFDGGYPTKISCDGFDRQIRWVHSYRMPTDDFTIADVFKLHGKSLDVGLIFTPNRVYINWIHTRGYLDQFSISHSLIGDSKFNVSYSEFQVWRNELFIPSSMFSL